MMGTTWTCRWRGAYAPEQLQHGPAVGTRSSTPEPGWCSLGGVCILLGVRAEAWACRRGPDLLTEDQQVQRLTLSPDPCPGTCLFTSPCPGLPLNLLSRQSPLEFMYPV